MPNWIEGNLKLRGLKKNIIRFFKEGIDDLYKYVPDKDDTGKPLGLKEEKIRDGVEISEDEDGIFECVPKDDSWIKNTRRAFVCGDGYIYFEDAEDEEEYCVCFSVKQAWAWVPDDWQNISKEYDLDVKLIGWEQGMCYKGECECLRGQEPVYKETTYDDWDWETECPNLGG